MKKIIPILVLPVYMIVCSVLICLYLHTSFSVMDKIAGICATDMQLYALGTIWFGLSAMLFALVFIGAAKILVKILNDDSSEIIVNTSKEEDIELAQTNQTLSIIMNNMTNTK